MVNNNDQLVVSKNCTMQLMDRPADKRMPQFDYFINNKGHFVAKKKKVANLVEDESQQSSPSLNKRYKNFKTKEGSFLNQTSNLNRTGLTNDSNRRLNENSDYGEKYKDDESMFRTIRETPFSLSFNRNNLIFKIDDSNRLTVAQRERLEQMLVAEKQKYKEEASKRFNSANNRSIMI